MIWVAIAVALVAFFEDFLVWGKQKFARERAQSRQFFGTHFRKQLARFELHRIHSRKNFGCVKERMPNKCRLQRLAYG